MRMSRCILACLCLAAVGCTDEPPTPVATPAEFACEVARDRAGGDVLDRLSNEHPDRDVCLWRSDWQPGDREVVALVDGAFEELRWARTGDDVETLDLWVWFGAGEEIDCADPALGWPVVAPPGAGEAPMCGQSRCCGSAYCVSYHLERRGEDVTAQVRALYAGCAADDPACLLDETLDCAWPRADAICPAGARVGCGDLGERGACANGESTCGGDAWSACPEPTDEVCDGADNDCDGVVDDVDELGDPCTVGTGACATDGVKVCDLAAGELVCDAVAGPPADEVCDGVDNDCDGTLDNVPGLGDSCEVGDGACVAQGMQVCNLATRALACDASAREPSDEVCDGIDNDCDGTPDNVDGLGADCSVGVGACEAQGATVCDLDAGALACDAVAEVPTVETCDGIDNDCDGALDEVEGLGDGCSAGVGACAAAGTQVCDLVAGELVCDAVPGAPGDETCNGVDDDCNGTVDDVVGLQSACHLGVGACMAEGQRVCDMGRGALVCDATVGEATEEICDDIDNDCDGMVDDVDGLGGRCDVGRGACQREGVYICDVDARRIKCSVEPGEPSGEVCNDIDDDCDGSMDEEVTNACGDCGEDPVETCNGLNDDCDDRVDEGTNGGSCQTDGAGRCAEGERRCEDGLPSCEPINGPRAELCDGIDDDCDGQIDEEVAGLGLCERDNIGPCIRDCRNGQSFCSRHEPTVGDQCNGKDDDCDGRIDELPNRPLCNEIEYSDIRRCGRLECIPGGNGVPVSHCNFGALGPLPVRPVQEHRGDNRDQDCDGRVDEAP